MAGWEGRRHGNRSVVVTLTNHAVSLGLACPQLPACSCLRTLDFSQISRIGGAHRLGFRLRASPGLVRFPTTPRPPAWAGRCVG